MSLKTADLVMIGGGVAALALGLYIWKKGGIGPAVSSAAAAAVGVVGDAAAGSVLGVGDAIGLPRTDQTECQKAIAEGRTWDASFACPAGDFLSSLWSRATGADVNAPTFGSAPNAGSGAGGIDQWQLDMGNVNPMGDIGGW